MIQRDVLSALILSLVMAGQLSAADWPQFLGPDRNGTSSETGLMDKFPQDGPEVVWRVSGGIGMSAVVIADGMALTCWNGRGKQLLSALDAKTGKPLWEAALADAYRNALGVGLRATPTSQDGVVYTLTGEGVLCAVELKSGRLIWQVDAPEQFETEPSEYGMSSSPLVVGGQVVVHVGGKDTAVAAFDAKTGKPAWTAGRGPAGYASPALLVIDGSPQIVSLTGHAVIGIAPQTGKTVWSYPFKTDYACNTANPVGVNRDVFISAGENHGCALLTIRNQNGAESVAERWKSLGGGSVMRNEWQTSVVVDGYLYGFDNVGAAGPVTNLRCLKVATGEPVWQKSRFGKGNLVLADGKLWITTMDGELVLAKATPDGYQELGRSPLLGETRQTLSIADGLGYLRDNREVVCIKLK